MNWIIAKNNLGKGIEKITVSAPALAFNCKVGQYVVVTIEGESEKIPFPVFECDPNKGTLSILADRNSDYTHKLANLSVGEELFSTDGPFGEPFEPAFIGTILCMVDRNAVEIAYPLIASLKALGNRIVVLYGADTESNLILSSELRYLANELIFVTQDGSMGRQGTIAVEMKKVLRNDPVDKIVALGNAEMIKQVCQYAQSNGITAEAIMLSGSNPTTKMVNLFRVNICDHSKLVCVDGEDFNAYYANFDAMVARHSEVDGRWSVGSPAFSSAKQSFLTV
jgi:NAD(P)H-flavin reductase